MPTQYSPGDRLYSSTPFATHEDLGALYVSFPTGNIIQVDFPPKRYPQRVLRRLRRSLLPIWRPGASYTTQDGSAFFTFEGKPWYRTGPSNKTVMAYKLVAKLFDSLAKDHYYFQTSIDREPKCPKLLFVRSYPLIHNRSNEPSFVAYPQPGHEIVFIDPPSTLRKLLSMTQLSMPQGKWSVKNNHDSHFRDLEAGLMNYPVQSPSNEEREDEQYFVYHHKEHDDDYLEFFDRLQRYGYVPLTISLPCRWPSPRRHVWIFQCLDITWRYARPPYHWSRRRYFPGSFHYPGFYYPPRPLSPPRYSYHPPPRYFSPPQSFYYPGPRSFHHPPPRNFYRPESSY